MEENELTMHPLNHTTLFHQQKPKCPIALAVPNMPSHKRQPKKSRYRKKGRMKTAQKKQHRL